MTEGARVMRITDELLDRWEPPARRRPQMGVALVLALIAEVRHRRATDEATRLLMAADHLDAREKVVSYAAAMALGDGEGTAPVRGGAT